MSGPDDAGLAVEPAAIPLTVTHVLEHLYCPRLTFFEHVLGIPTYLVSNQEIQLLRPRVDEALDRATSDLRLLKIHDVLHAGPSGEPIVSVAATRGAIYMIRDPRDVAVSLAHHQSVPLTSASRLLAGGRDPRSRTREAGSRLADNTLPQYVGSWSEHVCSWIERWPSTDTCC